MKQGYHQADCRALECSLRRPGWPPLFTLELLIRVYYYPVPPWRFESWGYGVSRGQNPERKGLIVKIFRNRELARFFAQFYQNSEFWRRADRPLIASIISTKE
jgi:hypothetical protein